MKQITRVTALGLAVLMVFLAITAVTDVHAGSVTLNKKKVTIEVGKSVTLKVKGTGKKVTWSSSNKKIAKVSKKVKVTAVKKGTATIYAKVAKKKLKCKITVKAKAVAQPVTPETKTIPLSGYWSKDSAAAAQLRSYVDKVTNAKDTANFIPAKDRIAVFDMDGTLTCETYFTYYDTMMFIDYCLTEHPGREVPEELKAIAKEIAPRYVADETLARNFAKAMRA